MPKGRPPGRGSLSRGGDKRKKAQPQRTEKERVDLNDLVDSVVGPVKIFDQNDTGLTYTKARERWLITQSEICGADTLHLIAGENDMSLTSLEKFAYKRYK